MTAAIETVERAVKKPVARFQFLSITELKLRPIVPWRVVDVIPGRGLIVLWGAAGSGKTFALIDLLMAIALGTPWNGRRVKRGNVVYVATEGSLRGRVCAHQEHHGYSEDECIGFRVLESNINLLDPDGDLPELLASLRELRKELRSIDVIAIDTLNRAMSGGNENSPDDMGAMVGAAKAIETEFQCALIYVHHSGKDEQRGARGHNSLKGAADAELSVRRQGTENVRELNVEKMRDGLDGATLLTFRLDMVDLGPMTDIDPDADSAERWTSCVMVPVECKEEKSRGRSRPIGANQRIVLEALQNAIREHGAPLPTSTMVPMGVVGVGLETLATYALPMLSDQAKGDQRADWRKRETMNRALNSLKGAGFIGRWGEHVWLA